MRVSIKFPLLNPFTEERQNGWRLIMRQISWNVTRAKLVLPANKNVILCSGAI
jgi:hypothetical protein